MQKAVARVLAEGGMMGDAAPDVNISADSSLEQWTRASTVKKKEASGGCWPSGRGKTLLPAHLVIADGAERAVLLLISRNEIRSTWRGPMLAVQRVPARCQSM